MPKQSEPLKTTLFEEYVDSGTVSLTELAEMLGYSPRHLRRIRNGQHPISETFVARVTLRLKRPPKSLFLPIVSEEVGQLVHV